MKRAFLILLLAGVVIIPLALSAQTAAPVPSLADVARQERARQKTATSKAIFTNETLGIPDAEPTPPAARPDKDKPAAIDKAVDKAVAETPKAAEPVAPHDEASWRDAFAKTRAEIKRGEDRSRVMQLDLNQLHMNLLMRSDIYNREGQLPPLIAAKEAELADNEKELEKARQKVTQMESELRRSGAPIGWSR